MGAAIEVFDGAAALLACRARASRPVKTTNDLLVAALRRLRADRRAGASCRSARTTLPFVDLDRRYYKLLADFEARFPAGPPSLREASASSCAAT